MSDRTTIHASCVALDGHAVLLRGAPGSGKSDLALRLIDQGGMLVADDQTTLMLDGAGLMAEPPAALAGLLEIRGVGIVTLDHVAGVPVVLAIDLKPGGAIERMPEPASCRLLGLDIPCLCLDPREASAPAKVKLAARALQRHRMAAR